MSPPTTDPASQPPVLDARGRDRRRARFLLLLVAMFGVPWVAYLGTSVGQTRSTRTDFTRSRNLDTARLSARLLDEQCSSALDEIKLLARHRAIVAATGGGRMADARAELKGAVDTVEDLQFVGLYAPNGALLAGYPEGLRPDRAVVVGLFPGTGRGPTFDSRVVRLRDREHTQVVGLAAPVGPKDFPLGYIFADYKLQLVSKWVQEANRREGLRTDILAVVGGTPVASTAPHAPLDSRLRQTALDAARSGSGPLPDDKLVAAFAVAQIPRWVVLVTQTQRDALAVTNYFLARMIFLSLVVAALMVLAALSLLRMYHKQDELLLALQARNQEMAQQGQANADFLANVSHDLWTPLAGLRFAVTSLLDTDVPWTPKQVRDSLLVASAEIDQMASRVRNLLEMSRLEAHLDKTPLQACDLESVVREALERAQSLLGDRPLAMDFPAAPLFIRCRQEQIQTVLLNLLENAAKYCPPEAPLLLKGYMQEGDVLFALDDKGPGICVEDLDRIFEKFYRAQPSHPMGGTGLGLAICKAIIEEHGGRTGAVNLPDGGAQFWFTLPAMKASKDGW